MAKYRKMLCDWDTPSIQSILRLIETQSKVTLATWAVDYAGRVLLPIWGKNYPDDPRPQEALQAARAWLAGSLKLPQAKAALLACHEAAREACGRPAAQAAARAIGQAASTIHAAAHCMGLPLYGALAVAYDELGLLAAWTQLENAAAAECWRMLDSLRAAAVPDEPNPAKFNWKCGK
jgi:hypothetical protein